MRPTPLPIRKDLPKPRAVQQQRKTSTITPYKQAINGLKQHSLVLQEENKSHVAAIKAGEAAARRAHSSKTRGPVKNVKITTKSVYCSAMETSYWN